MSSNAEKEQLPRWDLSEYYDGIDDPRIKADLAKALELTLEFEQKYKGRVAELSGDELADLIEDTDDDIYAEKPSYYASLLKSVDGNNPEIGRFSQFIAEEANKRGAHGMFFGLEMRAMGEEKLREKLAESPRLQKYGKIIEDIIEGLEHALPDDVEIMLQKLSPVGAGQFVRLYEEDKTRRRYHYRGEELTEVELSLHTTSKDIEERKEASTEKLRVTAENVHLPAFVMNNIIKHSQIMGEARGYAHAMETRNRSNEVEDEVVDTLIETVKENYEATQHRYNRLFANLLGKEKLDWWDSEKDIEGHVETEYTWEEAKQIILDAYRSFSSEMADIARKFFDNGWIDAEPRPGKRGGAFSMPGLATFHPHVFVNFQGRPDDVMTLAHELGHGVHQYLEMHTQPEPLQGTPLTIAETASIFGENVVFNELMARAQTTTEKRVLLFNKIGDDLGTAATQIMFVDFERRIHEARKEGELTPDEFGQIWKDCKKELHGDTANKDPERAELAKHAWSTIPHIFRTPFYVYAYSFGQLLVSSLFNAYEEGKIEGFQEKYLEALKAGGTKHHAELLAPFGLDSTTKEFWQGGLDVIIGRIDQLEALVEQEKAEKKAEEVANDNAPVKLDSIEVVGAARAEKKQAKGRG